MLRTHRTSSQLDLFDPFLPEEMKGLPAESGAVDEFLDDERFFAPYRAHFDPVWGPPSVPIETYLQKLIRSRTLRADTTTIEADISWPTAAGLLARAVGAMGRIVQRIKTAGGATRTGFRDRSRSAGRKMRTLTGSLRQRGAQRRTQIEHLTGELATICRQTKNQAETVLANARRALRQTPESGRLGR